MRIVLLGQYPGLKRKARRVRSYADKMVVLADKANLGEKLLPDNIAENASLLVFVVFPGSPDLINHVSRNNGKRNELGMGMIQAGAGRLAVIFKKQDEPKALVFFKVQNPIPVAPEDL